jgi:hypothetical protein
MLSILSYYSGHALASGIISACHQEDWSYGS